MSTRLLKPGPHGFARVRIDVQDEGSYRVWAVCGLHSCAIEQEADALRGLSAPFAEGIHQLLKVGSALDLEENLVVSIRDLDVEMLGLVLRLWWRGGVLVVRHVFSRVVDGYEWCLRVILVRYIWSRRRAA